jgi:xanthine dehydrogenase accessory factor
MTASVEDLYAQTRTGQVFVLVTVIAVRGSAPRGVGTKMIISASTCVGSIGGGQLEYQCTQFAEEMLGSSESVTRQKFSLGKKMGQCCGGAVEILFERLGPGCPYWLEDLLAIRSQSATAVVATTLTGANASKLVIDPREKGSNANVPEHLLSMARELIVSAGPSKLVDNVFLDVVSTTGFNIAVFGAGHVGSALVATLNGLDAKIRWVDNRPGIFQVTPSKVQIVETKDPLNEVAAMPPSSFYLVMTHSHSLDFVLCRAILMREDASYCGLIGSRSKRRQFEKRLLSSGVGQSLIDQLICPIGIDGIGGKTPKEIAIAVAAEILQFHDHDRTAATGGHS